VSKRSFFPAFPRAEYTSPFLSPPTHRGDGASISSSSPLGERNEVRGAHSFTLSSWGRGKGEGVFPSFSLSSRGEGLSAAAFLRQRFKGYTVAGRENTGCAGIHDISCSNITLTCSHHPLEIYVEEGISMKRLLISAFQILRKKRRSHFYSGNSQATI